jgi:hypothetical protein
MLLLVYYSTYDVFTIQIPSLKRRLMEIDPSFNLDTSDYTFEREMKGLEILKRAYVTMSPQDRAVVDEIDATIPDRD